MSENKLEQFNALLQEAELLKKVSPQFEEMSFDIRELMQLADNPAFLAALMFKLAEERARTNKLLMDFNEKFDKLLLEVKNQQTSLTTQQVSLSSHGETPTKLLPEQDQLIIQRAIEIGQVTAADIKTILGYKGLNAASQRLNKLYKEGHLKKIQSGKKVFYLAKQ